MARIPSRKASIPALIISLVLLAIGGKVWAPDVQKQIVSSPPGTYRVVEVYDGDTIAVDMNGINEKVRFIGVDTPETHDPRKAVQCFGRSASDFTKNTLTNTSVRLEADPLNQNRDRYNRLLRYVYLTDGRLLNAEIIKQGYGFAYLGFPFQKSDEFRTLQASARDNNRGLWGSCSPQQNDFGGFTSNDE